MLTRKQSELLTYVAQYQELNGGASPSFEEMKNAIGLRSKSGVHRLMTALKERGFVATPFNAVRAIQVVKLPRTLTVRNAYTSMGKEVLFHGEHFADALSPMAALAIASAMNTRPETNDRSAA